MMFIDNPPPFAGGGAGQHAYKLARELRELGHKVIIVCPVLGTWRSQYKPYNDVLTYCLGIPITSFNIIFSCFYNIRMIHYLIIRRNHYNSIHIQGIRAALSLLFTAKILKKKTVLTVLSEHFWYSLSGKWSPHWIQRIKHKILQNTDHFIVVNRSLINVLTKDLVVSTKIKFIPNGTNISEIIQDKLIVRQSLNLSPQDLIVLYAGRLHKQKNIPFLLRAWKNLNEQRSDMQLLLLGEGGEEARIKTLIDQYGLNHSVQLLGYRANVTAYMNAADIFVLPSRDEGCSNALLEAMSYRLACIATHSCGNAQIITNDINGLLIRFNDDLALSQAIYGLLNNQAIRDRMGQEARKTIRDRYSLHKTALGHIDIYQKGCSL